MLDIWGQLLIYFYCSLLKKQKTPPFLWQVPSVKVFSCVIQASRVFSPSSPMRCGIGVLGGRGVCCRLLPQKSRVADRLTRLLLPQLELVHPVCDTTAVTPRTSSFPRSVRLHKRFVGLVKMMSHLGKQCHFMSLSCYEYVKVKCMWIYYICTIKAFD